MFNKYKVERVCTGYGEYVEDGWEIVSENSISKPPLLYTNNSYSYDKYDKTFSVTRGELDYVSEDNKWGEYYYVKGGDLYKEVHEYRNIVAVWTSLYRRKLKYVETGETCRDVRGDYVGIVRGNANDYPRNGVLGGYWYVRGGLDESPVITSPTEGDVVSGEHLVKWDTSIDYGSGTEGVFLEISTDGGIKWQEMFRMGTGAYNQGELEFNFNKYGNTSKAMLRMFAVVNGEMTTPNETGVFQIIVNVPPSRPERERGGQRIFHKAESVPVRWTFEDDDIPTGDYQTKAELRITDSSGKHVKTIVHEGERTVHNLDVSDLTANKEYVVRITTYDRLGMKSPESLAYTFFLLDFVPKVEWLTGGLVDSKTPEIKFKPNFKHGRGVAKIYDLDGNLLEEGYFGSLDESYTVKTELKNLENYRIVIVPTGDFTLYGGGDMQEFNHVFSVMTPPPQDISVTLSKSAWSDAIYINMFRRGSILVTHFHIEKKINGRWELVVPKTPYGNKHDKLVTDNCPNDGLNSYRVTAYSEEGSYTLNPMPVSLRYDREFDALVSSNKATRLALRDIIKLEYEDKSDTATFQFLGARAPYIEYGEYRERRVSIELEVYNKSDLLVYREGLTSNVKYMYADREGRVLLGVIENYTEKELYNPHWFHVSFDIVEVGGDFKFAYTYF